MTVMPGGLGDDVEHAVGAVEPDGVIGRAALEHHDDTLAAEAIDDVLAVLLPDLEVLRAHITGVAALPLPVDEHSGDAGLR